MLNLNNKILPIWKPVNTLSNEIVYNIKKKYFVKAGHAGTRDPFAEGVLIVCTGEKTKDINKIHLLNKKYLAEIEIGSSTDTLDSDGKIIIKESLPRLNKKKIKQVLDRFQGKTMQRPPAFSALRRNNIRLYSLARKDIFISLKPREIYIDSIFLKSFQKNIIKIEVVCRTGTYIRSLAKDISKELNTCGYLKSLKRSSIGEYEKNNCYSYKKILDGNL